MPRGSCIKKRESAERNRGVGDGKGRRSQSETDFISDAAGIQASSQNGGARPDASENCGARATRFLGARARGVAARSEGEDSAAAAFIGYVADGGAYRVSVLN